MYSWQYKIILGISLNCMLSVNVLAECPLDHFYFQQENGCLSIDRSRLYQHGSPTEGYYPLSWSPIYQRWSVGEPGFTDTTDPAYGFPVDNQLVGTPGVDYEIWFEILDLSPDFKIQMNDGTWLDAIGDNYNLSNWTEHHVHMKYSAYVPYTPTPDYPFYVTFRLVDNIGIYESTPPFSVVFNTPTATVESTDPGYRSSLPTLNDATITFTFHRPIVVVDGPPVTITDEATQENDYTELFDYAVSQDGLTLSLSQVGNSLPNETWLSISLTSHVHDAATDYAAVPFTQIVYTHYIPGNCDGDDDLDLDDYAYFADCMEGPSTAVDSECQYADLDEDGNVDLKDFAEFQRYFTGILQY